MSEQFNIESVFEPDDYLYFYEEQLTEQRTAQEAEFIIAVLQPTVRQKILDLACGYGRHSIYLASKGYNVTGIDIISEFIDKAQREGVAKSLTVNFVSRHFKKTRQSSEAWWQSLPRYFQWFMRSYRSTACDAHRTNS